MRRVRSADEHLRLPRLTGAAGLPRAWLTPDIEVYYYARGPAKNLEVLSYGFDPRRLAFGTEITEPRNCGCCRTFSSCSRS